MSSSSSSSRRAIILPVEVWDYIITMIDGDRHLQSLSLVSKQFLSISNRHHQTLKISDPISSFLPSLFRRFPNLKHLSFSDFSGDPAPVLLQIADFDFPLESLDLSHHKILPVEALRRFPASILSGVKSLNIGSVSYDLEMIPNFFPNLEELDLSRRQESGYYDRDDRDDFNGSRKSSPDYDIERNGKKKTTDDGISVLVSKLKGLRRINLHGNKLITDKVLISLSDSCPDLEEIVLKESTNVTVTGIRFALGSTNLKKIILHGDSYGTDWTTDHICEALCRAKSLLQIDFRYMDVSDANLYDISEACLPLERFTLSKSPRNYDRVSSFTYAGILSFLKIYDSLGYLALEGVKLLSDVSMDTLAKCLTKVRVVKLNGCGKLSDPTLFTLIEQCPLLQAVEMKHTSIGKVKHTYNKAIKSQITTLILSSNEHLSNGSLRKIALACPVLETLHLRHCPLISGAGVANFLRKCHRLKHLQISGCLGVKDLDLYGRSRKVVLEYLGASKSGLSDEALIDISKKCPHLMFLNLKECEVFTSKGLKEVVDKCTELKEINLDGCENVTNNIMPWMVFCKPNLRKIVPPTYMRNSEENLYLRHGCYVKYDDDE